MRNTTMYLSTVALAAAILLTGSAEIFAQSQTQGNSGKRKLTHAEFQKAFWNYLTKGRSAYKKWRAFPGQSADIYEGQSPHGAFLRLYANSFARKDSTTLPHGSIIVKENYGKDQRTLMAVTVMYRAKGYDSTNYDWYWIKYNPDGTVAKTPKEKGSKPIAGRFQSCIQCHSDANGGDYSFAND